MKLAIITDIHEDVENLKTTLRKIEKLNCDEIACLGDISGFSSPHYDYHKTRNAHECLKLIKSNCTQVVLGNHDIHAAKIIPENCSFFDFPADWHDLDYHDRHKLAKDILWLHEEDDLNPLYKNVDIEYLKSIPEFYIIETQEINILLSHYVYPNLSGLKREFYTYRDEFKQHFEFMKKLDCLISFTGHSHIQGSFIVNSKKYKTHGYKTFKIEEEPVCIGIPPITSLQKKSGFCIFDTKDKIVQIVRL